MGSDATDAISKPGWNMSINDDWTTQWGNFGRSSNNQSPASSKDGLQQLPSFLVLGHGSSPQNGSNGGQGGQPWELEVTQILNRHFDKLDSPFLCGVSKTGSGTELEDWMRIFCSWWESCTIGHIVQEVDSLPIRLSQKSDQESTRRKVLYFTLSKPSTPMRSRKP